MPERSENQPLLIERIERALVLLAYFIHLDGDAHVAMYEKFEAELDELRRRESTKERARRLLASYSRSGQVKAIASKNLSLSSNDGPLPIDTQPEVEEPRETEQAADLSSDKPPRRLVIPP
jgi:hypothetical protein